MLNFSNLEKGGQKGGQRMLYFQLRYWKFLKIFGFITFALRVDKVVVLFRCPARAFFFGKINALENHILKTALETFFLEHSPNPSTMPSQDVSQYARMLKQCFYDGGRMDGKLCDYNFCRYQHFLQKHPKEIFRERMKSKKE